MFTALEPPLVVGEVEPLEEALINYREDSEEVVKRASIFETVGVKKE